MCNRGDRERGGYPAFRLSFNLPKTVRKQAQLGLGLLLACSHLGCAGTSHLQRTFALRSLLPAKSNVNSREAVAKDQSKKPTVSERVASDESQILLVNEQVDADSTDVSAGVPDSSTAVKSAPDSAMSTNPALNAIQYGTSMTLSQLEGLALQYNPTLLQAQAAINAEQGLYTQAGLYPNPQVGYLNGSASNPGVKSSNGLFLSQEFVMGNKLELAQQKEAVELERFQFDYESQRMRVMNDLRIRYYEVIGAQEACQFATQMVTLAEKGLDIAEKQEKAGFIPRTELNNAIIQLETVRLAQVEAENRRIAAWKQLATMIGDSSMAAVPLVGDLASDIPQLDEEASWQQLLVNSPQLQSNQRDLGHAWASYREECAKPIPNITVQTVGEYDRVTQATTFSTLVALPLPIFNGNQGNIEKASADICANEAEIRRVQLVLREQMADAFKRYRTALHQVDRLQKVILPTLEQNLNLATHQFEKDQLSLTPVLAARKELFHSQMAYVESLTELHKVKTEIQGMLLTGGLNPAAIGSAIQSQPGGGGRQRNLLMNTQEQTSKQLLNAASISQ